MMRMLWLALMIGLTGIVSCKKDKTSTPDASLDVRLRFYCDHPDSSFVWSTLKYRNAADNLWSGSRLQMYLSAFELTGNDGAVYRSRQSVYIDAKRPEVCKFMLNDIPAGKYNRMNFILGLPPEDNFTGSLPSTTDNVNMAWPDPMGGGYHFLKFEGTYEKSPGSFMGFAFHLGKNGFQVPVSLPVTLEFNGTSQLAELRMDLNEAFKTPYLWDLSVENNYTMSDSTGKERVKNNLKDAFTLAPNP